MDGPITCHQLRNIKNMFEESEFNKFVSEVIKNIKLSVITYAYQATGPHAIIVPRHNVSGKHTYKVEFSSLYQRRNLYLHLFDKSSVFSNVMEGLRQVFPDMRIVSDPLNTYILLDWS